MLAGVHDRTVVFGHSHQQFRRPGPNGTDLVNPGSAGMPLDGDVRSCSTEHGLTCIAQILEHRVVADGFRIALVELVEQAQQRRGAVT